jgi:hypothetical protein
LEDNIKMDLQEVGWDGVACIDVAQNRDKWWELVTAVMNYLFLQNAGIFLTNGIMISFSRQTLLHGVTIVIYTL